MGSLQIVDVRVKMSCRGGPGQANPSILHGFGCQRQLWCLGRSFWTQTFGLGDVPGKCVSC